MTVSNVYIVEDDPVIAGAVADHLATWQMAVADAEQVGKGF